MVGLGIVISFRRAAEYAHDVMEPNARSRHFKALGFSRFDVVRMLLGEMLVLTLLGSGWESRSRSDSGNFEGDQPELDDSYFGRLDFQGDYSGGGRRGPRRGVSGASRGELPIRGGAGL